MDEQILSDDEWSAEVVAAAAEIRRAMHRERKAKAAERGPWVL